jgi:quercetin dioxygenase-like cupin family protein
MTAQLISTPYHLPNRGGPALWHLGALLTVKATASQTGGRLWAKELLAERGMATPIHRHSREDEAFYVLEGEISVHVGDEVVRAQEGDFLWAPRGVGHAFCVESARVRVLVVSTPAGFEQFFFDTGQPATELTVPPTDTTPHDPDSLISALAGYGVEVLGPPPLPVTPDDHTAVFM